MKRHSVIGRVNRQAKPALSHQEDVPVSTASSWTTTSGASCYYYVAEKTSLSR